MISRQALRPLVEVTPTEISSSDARHDLGPMLDAVLAGRRFILTRHGREHAALIPVEALRVLEELERETYRELMQERLEQVQSRNAMDR